MGQKLEVVRSLADKLETDAVLRTEVLVNVSHQVDECNRAVPDEGLGLLVVPEKRHSKGDLIGERKGVLGLLAHIDGCPPIVEAGYDFAEFLDLSCRSLRLSRLRMRVVERVVADVGDRLGADLLLQAANLVSSFAPSLGSSRNSLATAASC